MKKITVLVFLLIIATVAVVMIMLNVTKYDSVSTINKDQGELNAENKNFNISFDFDTKTVTLNSGYEMPILGLGTWAQSNEETATSVYYALEDGYRLIDTAQYYGNEKGVGDRLAPLLIAEIGDIRRFKNAGSLIAYAGIDSPPYQSGKYEATNRHISKRGNKYLRKTGFEVM